MAVPTDPQKHAYLFTDDIKFFQKAIIFHPKEQKFLAIKRSPSSFMRPNCWDLPGGNVLYGENHLESLKKEIKEETGLIIDNFKPLHITTNYDETRKMYYLFIGYTTQSNEIKVTLSHEHSQYKWLTKEEFMKKESADYLQEFINVAIP